MERSGQQLHEDFLYFYVQDLVKYGRNVAESCVCHWSRCLQLLKRKPDSWDRHKYTENTNNGSQIRSLVIIIVVEHYNLYFDAYCSIIFNKASMKRYNEGIV